MKRVYTEKMKAWRKQYYLKNRERLIAKQKQYYIDNPKKMSDRAKVYRFNNLDREKHSMLKRFYNITLETYNEMFVNQEGKCLICGTHQNELKRALSVDHDHITGKVRGLLCNKCNFILGHSRENIDILKSVIKYLEINE
jgi:hypothetical protein